MKRKLVRDKIPKICKKYKELYFLKATDLELIKLLKEKLMEEAQEVYEAPNKAAVLEELADVLEVMTALAKKLNHEFMDVVELCGDKRREKGGFDEGWTTDQVDELKKLYNREKETE